MEEPGAPLSVATDVVPITLELVADEVVGDAALIQCRWARMHRATTKWFHASSHLYRSKRCQFHC